MLRRKITGMLRLFRPELPLAAGICTVTGQVLAAGSLPPAHVALLGFLCVFFLSASALISNDYFDYEVDRINHPGRPLPSGMVTKADVVGLTIFTTLVGLAAALALGAHLLPVSALFWLVGFLYNWRFKESGLPGNLMVAASVAGTFVFGALSVGAPWSGIAWVFALIAFFIDLGEEIAGDAMDMEGDRQRASRSLALLHGRRFALRLAVACWGAVVLLSVLPLVFGWLGWTYLAFMLGMDALLVYFGVRLLRSMDSESGRRAMRGAYIGASLGMAAFLVGLFVGR